MSGDARSGSPTRDASRLVHALGALLWLYPPRFRERYGNEWRDAVDRLASERRYTHAAGRWRLVHYLLADALPSAAREWGQAIASAFSSEMTSAPPHASIHPLDYAHRPTERRMGNLWQDIRYAMRSLARHPGFATVVILSLALGIGANTLIYSVVDSVVLRPFPYPDPDRLVAVGVTYPKVSSDRSFLEAISPPEYLDIGSGVPSLQRHTVLDLGNRTLSGGDRPERVFSAFVWGDPFATVGVAPALGRGFRPDETTSEGSDVIVLSHRIWQARFGGDSSLVGRSVRVNGRPLTVVGIMPPSLLLLGTDLWMPMGADPKGIPRTARQWAVIGRVRDGATLVDVNRELAQVAASTERVQRAEFPEYEGWRLEAAPWAEAMTDRFRVAAIVLQVAVGLVLLIACANVAALLVSRAATRYREIAVRRALGANGMRLARQLLTESILLSTMGGIVGLGITLLVAPSLSGVFPEILTSMGIRVTPNARLLLFALLTTLAVGILFGLAPSLQLLRRGSGGALAHAGNRATMSRTGRLVRASFLGVQVALSVMLLIGAGVLVRSFTKLQEVELGFAPERVLTMRISLSRESYAPEAVAPFFDALTTQLRAIPGVREASATTQFPPSNSFTAPLVLGGETAKEATARVVDVTNVTSEYFRTLGYRLAIGRLFETSDRETSPLVAVINETAAKRYFPGTSPLGQRVRLGAGDSLPMIEIVGVTGDVRNRGLDAPVAPEIFIPVRQQRAAWNSQLFVLVQHVHRPDVGSAGRARGPGKFDPDQPIYAISTIEREMGNALFQRRAATLLILIFAAIAMLLAAVGIYGLVSYSVSERVHEIGIRMALGAGAGDVRRMLMRQTLAVVGAGRGGGDRRRDRRRRGVALAWCTA